MSDYTLISNADGTVSYKTNRFNTREAWLKEAMELMVPWFKQQNAPHFEMPLVSVGWRKGTRTGSCKGKTIGQCWDKKGSGDKKAAHIFFSPEMTDEVRVLGILLHEMVHAALGTAVGHRKPFKDLATALGMEGKMTATTESDELVGKLKVLLGELGTYPHPGLDDVLKNRKKPGSRLIKVMCHSCGCIIRMTRTWIENVGTPICGCGLGGEMDEE